ncbi:MAG: SO_0444 family Cu/Zn efflux transporter [Gammaproteobacteria bacterium]|nr:SO_0444 family Cu/Zn efflux transporter [Gammaproteobacteria bacterium]
MNFLKNLYEIFLEAAPWLLLGFIFAGIIKVSIAEPLLNRWLDIPRDSGCASRRAPATLLLRRITHSLPTATALYRGGASHSATVSFLIATPETGVDSIALSYVMLGPVMAVIRPVAAILSAVATGLTTALVTGKSAPPERRSCLASGCGCDAPDPTPGPIPIPVDLPTSCCSDDRCSRDDLGKRPRSPLIGKLHKGLHYALVEMVDDLLLWLTIGVVLAALIDTLFPPLAMAAWGSGVGAMLLMVIIGIPMYICATASTPVAAALLLAGISPGTVLVFLLAGPATNIATMGVIQKEMGGQILAAYLAGITLSSIALGLLTDWLIVTAGWNITAQMADAGDIVPDWLATAAALVLLLAAANVLWRRSLQQK